MQTKQIIKKTGCFIAILIISILFCYNLGLCESEDEILYPDVPRIGASEAFKLFKEGVAIVADVSDRDRYKNRHIFGSISLPGEGAENVIVDRAKIRIPEDKRLLLYCH